MQMQISTINRHEVVKALIFVAQIAITGVSYIFGAMAFEQGVTDTTAQDWIGWITGPFGGLLAACFISYVLYRMYRQNDREFKDSLIKRAETAEKRASDAEATLKETQQLLKDALDKVK